MTKAFPLPLDIEDVSRAIPEISILDELQTGGQGAVYKVHRHDRICALKIYGINNTIKRIDREIESLKSINSPHIVKLISHGTASIANTQYKYVILDYIDGKDLTSCASMTDADVRMLLKNITKGIEALWEKRVVHRDIKPSNIMKRRGIDDYVVIDLGIAKHLDRSQITQWNQPGTPGYMSPEQASGRLSLTFRSDLFSLGIVAYEAASHQHPFNMNQSNIGAISPRVLHTICGVSKKTSDIVHHMLETSSMRRPKTCVEIYSVL